MFCDSLEKMRTRGAIFTVAEKEFVKRMIFKRKTMIENKKTDAATLEEKKIAWEELTEEYNSIAWHTNKRTTKQLKKLWDNIKNDEKKELRKHKSQGLDIIEGPPLKVPKEEPADDGLMAGLFTTAIERVMESDTIALSQLAEDNLIMDATHEAAFPPICQMDVPSSSVVQCDRNTTEGVSRIHHAPRPKTHLRFRRAESSERTRRVQQLTANDQELHIMLMEEQHFKTALAKLQMMAKEQELQQSADAHALDMEFKKKKYEMEILLLERKLEKN